MGDSLEVYLPRVIIEEIHAAYSSQSILQSKFA